MNWPRIIGGLLILFCVFFVLTSPNEAADATRTFFGGVDDAAHNLATYVKALLK